MRKLKQFHLKAEGPFVSYDGPITGLGLVNRTAKAIRRLHQQADGRAKLTVTITQLN